MNRQRQDGLSIQTKAFVGVTASIGVVVLGFAFRTGNRRT